MEEVDLFLQIGRKVIEKGRKSLQRLQKIEANLRELHMKYVAQTGEHLEDDPYEEELEIAVEDLFFTSERDHEDFVFDQAPAYIPKPQNIFKTTGVIAKEEQQLHLRGPIMGKDKRLFIPNQKIMQKNQQNQTQEPGIPDDHGKTIANSTKENPSLNIMID